MLILVQSICDIYEDKEEGQFSEKQCLATRSKHIYNVLYTCCEHFKKRNTGRVQTYFSSDTALKE